MCIVCIANNINRNVYMYLNTRIFPTTGYARVLLFMFIRRELGVSGTGCLFQFTYCVSCLIKRNSTLLALLVLKKNIYIPIKPTFVKRSKVIRDILWLPNIVVSLG